jgi:single-strand DNA-binding protein
MLKAILIGNLGNDPDMRYSANGSPLLRFNVASNSRSRTPEGEWQDRTEWVRVTVTGNRAESLQQYLKKGSRVYVEGRLEARPWTDQQGEVRAGLELTASEVEFVSSRGPTIDMDDDAPAPASVADERPSHPMPQDMAVADARGGAAVADRDASSELEDLPF